MGVETAIGSAPVGTILPRHATTAIAAADRLAAATHREVMAPGVRPRFREFWFKFYNDWLTYRTLHADREALADPARVMEQELPAFTRRIYEWRNALARETGCGQAASVGGAQAAQAPAARGSLWRPILVLAGVGAGGWLVKRWWDDRRKSEAQARAEEIEADRRRAIERLPAITPSTTVAQPAPQYVVQQLPYHGSVTSYPPYYIESPP